MARTRRSPTEQFGDRVRARRRELGLTQEALAEAAALHPTYISGIERGGRNVGLRNIVRIAQALEVDPGDLVEGLRG